MAIAFVLSIAVLFHDSLAAVLLVAATLALSFISQVTRLKRFGLELVTFTVVLLGVSYGPMAGLLAGLSLEFVHVILIRRAFQINNLWAITGFGLAGFIAGHLTAIDMVLLGIGLTLFLHSLHIVMTTLVSGRPGARYSLLYLFPNIILNVLLFMNFSAPALRLL